MSNASYTSMIATRARWSARARAARCSVRRPSEPERIERNAAVETWPDVSSLGFRRRFSWRRRFFLQQQCLRSCNAAATSHHGSMVAPAPGAAGACCDWLRGLPSTHLGHRRRGASPRRMQQALHCIKHLHHATSTLLILELRRRLERTGVGNAGAEECSVEWHTPPVRWLCAVLWYATVGRPKGRTWLERMCATRIVCPARDYVAPHTRRGGGSMADGTCWGGRRCASARQRYTNRHVGRSFATNVVRAVWEEGQCPPVYAPSGGSDPHSARRRNCRFGLGAGTSSHFGSVDSRCELTLEVRSRAGWRGVH